MNTLDQLKALQEHTGREFSASPSPFMKWLNPIVRSADTGKLVFEYVVRKEMTNPMKTLHGGVTAAIIDDIIGATMISFNEPFFYTTVSNNINYFAPAHEGDVLVAETIVIKKGRRLVHAQCNIWNNKRTRLIARGTSILLKTTLAKSKT